MNVSLENLTEPIISDVIGKRKLQSEMSGNAIKTVRDELIREDDNTKNQEKSPLVRVPSRDCLIS